MGDVAVNTDCWLSNSNIFRHMLGNKIRNLANLNRRHLQRIVDMAKLVNRSFTVYEEVFNQGVQLDKGTVVQIRSGDHSLLLNEITRKGYSVVLSNCGNQDRTIICDPHDFKGSDEQKKLVIGFESIIDSATIKKGDIAEAFFFNMFMLAKQIWTPSKIKLDHFDLISHWEEHTFRWQNRDIQQF